VHYLRKYNFSLPQKAPHIFSKFDIFFVFEASDTKWFIQGFEYVYNPCTIQKPIGIAAIAIANGELTESLECLHIFRTCITAQDIMTHYAVLCKNVVDIVKIIQ
jgi:hypothetical protein